MKSLRYLCISLILLTASNVAVACWHPWYTPKGYFMYRVYNIIPEAKLNIEYQSPNVGKNCEMWQQLTSQTIPLEDIYHVVYKMDLESFQTLYDSRVSDSENKFVQWIIKKDTAILDFLLLAKTNEYIRVKRNSRWYYPTMKIGAKMTLEEIADSATSVKDDRLRHRYLLQGVRALFSLDEYEKCVQLWEKEVSHWADEDFMKQLIKPYIAGAEFHLNHSDKAIEYFAQIGDVQSMLFCLGRTGEKLSVVDALELVCEYAPNTVYVEQTLQKYIRKLEPDGEYYRIKWNEPLKKTQEIDKLYDLCIKMARSGRSNNPAMWHYTAAFLEDLCGNASGASKVLSMAEKSKSSDYIRESIKIFRIYLDAKLLPYDANYETLLFGQLRWLDKKIQSNIDENVRKETASGFKLYVNENYYYWNDMMRRILLSEVCPRMIKSGKTTLALQLANMADNSLLNIVNRYEILDFDDNVLKSYTMHSFRYSSTYYNIADYSNSFFEMVDSIGIEAAIKYVKRVDKPQNKFDKFLNARGYVGSDYLNDIIGTQCLRNMRYKEAYEYLGKVSLAYKDHLNVYMKYNPFSNKREKIQQTSDFRYDFAREMYSLEQAIKQASDPNRRALLMVKYAIGIRNSFDLCWALTQYYRGESFYGQVCEKRNWETDEYTLRAKKKSEEILKLAPQMCTDDETAANIHYSLHHYLTVAQNYPHTEKAALVRGKCDNLCDY